MSVKRTLDYSDLIVNGDMSSSITSSSTNILYTDRVGYQLVWTGTPSGTFTLEVSNDETTWVSVDTGILASGAAGDAFIDFETAAKFVRLVYTASSGSGTLNAHITAKSISG